METLSQKGNRRGEVRAKSFLLTSPSNFLKGDSFTYTKRDLSMYFAQISTDPDHPWFSWSIIMQDNGVTVYGRQAAE